MPEQTQSRCRLRVEIGEVTDYAYYPDGSIARSNNLKETILLIREWSPKGLTRWQRGIVWMLGQGPITLVNASNNNQANIPPRWFFGDR